MKMLVNGILAILFIAGVLISGLTIYIALGGTLASETITVRMNASNQKTRPSVPVSESKPDHRKESAEPEKSKGMSVSPIPTRDLSPKEDIRPDPKTSPPSRQKIRPRTQLARQETPAEKPPIKREISSKYIMSGLSGFYADKFQGRKTASGQVFDPNKLTAAHNTLPLPCRVLAYNPKHNKQAFLIVNDRGKFEKYGRFMDLSPRSFTALGGKPRDGIMNVVLLETCIDP